MKCSPFGCWAERINSSRDSPLHCTMCSGESFCTLAGTDAQLHSHQSTVCGRCSCVCKPMIERIEAGLVVPETTESKLITLSTLLIIYQCKGSLIKQHMSSLVDGRAQQGRGYINTLEIALTKVESCTSKEMKWILTSVMTGAGQSDEGELLHISLYTHLLSHQTHWYSALAARHKLQSPLPWKQLYSFTRNETKLCY